ncbi:ABC transporter permease [Alloalcanivorax marinus]|uniref:ABC transporter permease n=1 Tax=Alloalcanivorax marinus TaxID=1177169 RepID=UPI001934385F|nr:ABC transporter permease [Alloalcanivorax marinus]MBL7249059.1 ABC transporter permease [Alloalcanivorax marinus]
MIGFSPRRLWAVVTKELRQLKRDRLTYAMIVGIPIMQLLLFGYAINMDVRHLPAAVVDQAHSSRSRQVIDELHQARVFDFLHAPTTADQAQRLLRAGDIKVILVVPADFEHRLTTDQPPLQLIVDGSDQVVQQAARQLSQFPVRAYLNGQSLSPPAAQVAVVAYYNPDREAPLNTVPGLIGVILTMTMVMFTAIALVREREHGNQEFLITTPLSSAELTLGKVLPFIAIGLIQTSLVLLLGKLIFQVPVRGPLLDLYLAALVFIVASLALGILISTVVRSQFQAMQAAIFTFLPQILLSGFMFPFEGMPRPAQWFAEILPLTHFVRLSRGIMLRGADLSSLWPELLALTVFSVVALSVAILRVNKRLD